jgi:hypothetical protein
MDTKIKERRIVTKASDDTTFQVGDHILVYEDGCIGCIEAQGWIDTEDVPEATKGMESILDKEFMQKYIEELNKKIKTLQDSIAN